MTEVTQTDEDGCTITWTEYKGIRFPKFINAVQQVDNLQTLGIRDDDVLIVSFPKSGTHWVNGIVNTILNEDEALRDVTRIDQGLLEMAPAASLVALQSPRILTTHLPDHLLTPDMFKKKIKIIHVIRNPKDACVSGYNQIKKMLKVFNYHGTFKAWLELTLSCKEGTMGTTWWKYVRAWEDFASQHPDLPIYTVYYEDLKEDLRGGAKKIADFLNVTRPEKTFDDVIRRCTFTTMKEREDKKDHEMFKALWNDNSSGFYRKGEVADWKNWFTVSQNERFEALVEQEMKGSNIKIIYTI